MTDHAAAPDDSLVARIEETLKDNDGAAETLHTAAVLADAPLPYDFALATEGTPHNPSLINPAAAFFAATAVMDPLVQSGLVQADVEAQTFTIPQDVRRAVLHAAAEDARREWAARAIYAVNLALPDADGGDWEAVERLMPHIEACRDLVDALELNTPAANRLLHQTGFALHGQGRHQEAAAYLDHALKVDLAIKGPGHPDVAADLEGLGAVLWAAGDLERAEAAYLKCLQFQTEIFTEDNPVLATTYNSLGVIRQSLGRLDLAEGDFVECLRILTSAHGEGHPSIAACLGNLSLVYEATGRREDALRLAERALEINRTVYGEDHPDVAADLNTVALLREACGDCEGAERGFRDSLDVRRTVHGDAHPETAQSFCNLALLLHTQGRPEESMEMYERGLDAYEAALGPDHPMMEQALDNCMALLEQLVEDDRAPLRAKAVERLSRIVKKAE